MLIASSHKSNQFFVVLIELCIVVGAFYFVYYKLTTNDQLQLSNLMDFLHQNDSFSSLPDTFFHPSFPLFLLLTWLLKGSVAVYLFSMAGVNDLTVLCIVTLMWIFNFVIPSVFGSYYVLNFNLSNIKQTA